MNEEEKQELETLRAEKLRREQVERARAALERGGVPQSFAPLLAGATTVTRIAGRRNSARRIRHLWRRT